MKYRLFSSRSFLEAKSRTDGLDGTILRAPAVLIMYVFCNEELLRSEAGLVESAANLGRASLSKLLKTTLRTC